MHLLNFYQFYSKTLLQVETYSLDKADHSLFSDKYPYECQNINYYFFDFINHIISRSSARFISKSSLSFSILFLALVFDNLY